MNTNTVPSRPATQAIADMRIAMEIMRRTIAKLDR